MVPQFCSGLPLEIGHHSRLTTPQYYRRALKLGYADPNYIHNIIDLCIQVKREQEQGR